jgi:hypothetical protein
MAEHEARSIPEYVPHYTGSLDASVQGEHIVCVQYDESSSKWIAVNRNERGVLHVGVGNTEVLARRIAGLKALDAAKAGDGGAAVDFVTRRNNLVDSLDRLADTIEKNNDYRAKDPGDQRRRLAEVKSFRDLLRTPGAFVAGVAAGLMATLTYLMAKFADSLIGKLAEVAAKLLEKLIGN